MKMHDHLGNLVNVKRTPVMDYIMTRLLKLHPGYIVSHDDFEWMNEINRVHGRKPITNVSLVAAVNEALPEKKEEYFEKAKIFSSLCDPWELLIDSGICTTKCKPIL